MIMSFKVVITCQISFDETSTKLFNIMCYCLFLPIWITLCIQCILPNMLTDLHQFPPECFVLSSWPCYHCMLLFHKQAALSIKFAQSLEFSFVASFIYCNIFLLIHREEDIPYLFEKLHLSPKLFEALDDVSIFFWWESDKGKAWSCFWCSFTSS